MIGPALASVCRLVSGPTVEWRCDPYSDAQRIYFGNHASHLDFIVIWSALPLRARQRVRPIAGRDYWERGPLRRYVADDVFRAILIDRGNHDADNAVAAAQKSVERIAREMSGGDSVIVFPEGTRSVDGEIGPFKSGLYHLARAKPAAELIPVHLENLNRILPKGELLPVPMLSRVVFGPRLDASVGESKDAFLARARRALGQLRAHP
jgi:1-acyl-sn-glycerol-3-phosphate acyltransferase